MNATCKAPPRPVQNTGVAVVPAFSALTFVQPVDLVQAPGDPSRAFVLEKPGRVKVFSSDEATTATGVFVDLTDRVNADSEEAGLLGLAFHPSFSSNHRAFVAYTRDAPTPSGLRLVLSEMSSKDGGKTLDPASEEVLLSLDKDYPARNGGHLAFGLDGRLYMSIGDGGSPNDELGNAQSLSVLFGKILRLDVDTQSPYGIPPDNPYAKGGGAPEIFARGFRNPWRFSFDRATGELWAGDVGQSEREEIDLVAAGCNYGWPIKEGTLCYNAASCDSAGLIDPVVEYTHTEGVAVSGGYVYRGSLLPSLVGRYLFGDFGTGKIWAIGKDPNTGAPTREIIAETGLNIPSFGESLDGEIYVVNFQGDLRKLVPTAPEPAAEFPVKLSATGCVDPTDATKPASGLIPYDVNAPFWSDGAQKQRHMALPDGAQVSIVEGGDLDLPVGSVLMKTISLGGVPFETRLLVRHDDGGWAGYSYEWDADGKDATWLPTGKTKEIGGQTWTYPSGDQCLACHTAAAGRTLGPEIGQLGRKVVYPGGIEADQIATLDHIGLFATTPPADVPVLPDPYGDGPLEARAKAYLHTNCSICHRPGGPGQGPADFRFTTPLSQMGVCDQPPEVSTLGIEGAKLLAPGAPEKSVICARVHSLGPARMPPLGSHVVDGEGASLLDAYIASLTGCP